MITNKAVRTALVVSALLASGSAFAGTAKDEYLDFEQMEFDPQVAGDQFGAVREAGTSGAVIPHVAGAQLVSGFQGISQYDVASYGRNFIPPDTMGAVGRTQYTSFANGGFAVFDKSTGGTVKATSDVDFWAAAGQTGSNGDSRVMFNAAANRWIALSFGDSVSDIQIAVSKTADAAGAWQSIKFTGFAGGTADYPTLAMDTNAVYIGTNNFDGSGSFAGTSLNIIPLKSIFSGSAPSTTGLARINTPYSATTGGDDGGYAIQGVNNTAADSTGHIVSASLFYNDVIRYDIPGAGTAGAMVTPISYVGAANYDGNGPARQPNAVPDVPPATGTTFTSNDRVIDTLDSRIGSSTYEVDGRIYAVYTVTPVGGDFTYVRYDVIDVATNTLLDEGMIGDGKHDYFQGSLAVNKYGQVLIGYNRSGSDVADGKISVLAQAFSTDGSGHLTLRGSEQLLKTSLVDDYHNGSIDGFIAKNRQRWGDYSAVSLDPNDDRTFWVIGEYAREYNDASGGHPLGTGGSRWSTWISQLNVGTTVPEPATWALMITGFGFVGVASRRRRAGYATA